MEKTTRRNFIGAIAAIGALPLIGKSAKQDDWFEDIRVDRYYVLQGGQYGDTGGCGCPGYELGAALITDMKYWKQSCYLEYNIEYIEKRGYYLTPSTYFEKPWRRFDRIYLTKRWMMEFYNRHKNEVKNDWESRYDRYLNDVNSGTYTPENKY
jgi:hypothetical protein